MATDSGILDFDAPRRSATQTLQLPTAAAIRTRPACSTIGLSLHIDEGSSEGRGGQQPCHGASNRRGSCRSTTCGADLRRSSRTRHATAASGAHQAHRTAVAPRHDVCPSSTLVARVDFAPRPWLDPIRQHDGRTLTDSSRSSTSALNVSCGAVCTTARSVAIGRAGGNRRVGSSGGSRRSHLAPGLAAAAAHDPSRHQCSTRRAPLPSACKPVAAGSPIVCPCPAMNRWASAHSRRW
jgi:hypothetical protein